MEPCATPNILKHFLCSVVRCPHLPSAGGWIILLQSDGTQVYSLLRATGDGQNEVQQIKDTILNDPSQAAAVASQWCGTKIDVIEWVESTEDGKWIQAANLWEHRRKDNLAKHAKEEAFKAKFGLN
jgi:hypothetical protein